jgi:hypothetical protein
VAISSGVTAGYADVVIPDTPFGLDESSKPLMSTYISVGSSGNIVFRNTRNELQYLPNVSSGTLIPIAATEIVVNGNVRGIPRTTTASEMGWLASARY